MAKRLDSRYFPDLRSAGWSRIDFPVRAELTVAGWVRSSTGGRLESLVLARPGDDGTLEWVGLARGGLTLAMRTELAHHLGRLVTDRPTVDVPPGAGAARGRIRWLRPDLRIDVAARDEDVDGRLVDPVLLGLLD